MRLTSRIVPYDPHWPAHFADEDDRLASVFAARLVRIHHVGSTAVPDLAAKPEIDVLVEVRKHDGSAASEAALRALGYVRGGDL